ncbi:MAG: helix-turn-helix domain-containing protein [Bacilli bacterium]|nr:helix-turn-helix domain-containing protein [Bacilli bacterium]
MPKETLQEFIDRKPNHEEFHTYLFRLMKERDLSDPDVYKKAGIDRKTWSKLISNDVQRPTKRHVAKIVIAMELPCRECKHLIKSAGYILNRDPFDMVIRYCIEQRIYDPMKVDELLVKQNLKPLFSE